MELKIIDFSQKHFECGGRKFYVKESLGFVRYRELQKLNLEFGYSATFIDIFQNLQKAWEFLNATKLGDAAVILHNVMHGVVQLEDKNDPALRLCALFIDEEGEDPTVYDEGKMKDKIECWGRECAVHPFFQLASNLVPNWMPIYRVVIQNGSLDQKE